jgi:predicted CoA-binding protein
MGKKTHPQTVVVLGASDKPQRYSYKAVILLRKHGHKIIPVHPRLDIVDNIPVVSQLADIKEPVDTLTLYIGSERSQSLHEDIIALAPGRVIFNPGTASSELESKLAQAGIAYVHDCTLVMLQSNGF